MIEQPVEDTGKDQDQSQQWFCLITKKGDSSIELTDYFSRDEYSKTYFFLVKLIESMLNHSHSTKNGLLLVKTSYNMTYKIQSDFFMTLAPEVGSPNVGSFNFLLTAFKI